MRKLCQYFARRPAIVPGIKIFFPVMVRVSAGFERYVGVYLVTTMDDDPVLSPSICADVLTFDYQAEWSPGYFDMVWISIPCRQYSIAKNGRVRNLTQADEIAQRALAMLEYLQPRQWFIENSELSRLWNRVHL